MSGPGTKVVEIPVSLGRGVKTLKEVHARKQLEIAALAQRHWADNQVSCTVTFDPETEGHLLPELLDEFQHQLKGISFLPNLAEGAYPQMPYEEITLAHYADMARKLKPLNFESIYDKTTSDPEKDNFCDNDGCKI
jgi:ribonucleoside-triphosphate reductase